MNILRFRVGVCVFLLTGLGLTSCAPAPDFHVSLTVVDSEHSEDSNSQTDTLTIDGYKGTYHWVYDGYTPNEDWDMDREYKFKLNDEQMQELTLLIRENGLMVSRNETVLTSNPWSGFDVSWNMSMGGQDASGHVVGEPISWEAYSGEDVEAPADESWYAASEVVYYIRELVGFEY